MFSISRDGSDHIIEVDALDQVEPVIPAEKLGRYHIDEMDAKPLPSGHTARRCGVGIKKADGSVVIEADPWES
jgi:hypothetical protein